MSTIKLISQNLVEQIVPSGIIQHPSCITREILENAIDANSSSIILRVQDNEQEFISVEDNGFGMSEEELKLCFKRHYSSKIKQQTDLLNIKSMGFRGEALALITEIADLEIKSRKKGEKKGVYISIENKKIKDIQHISMKIGTSIRIKKFLRKKRIGDIGNIIEEFKRIAFANSNINMRLIHNGQNIYYLEKSNFRKRIVNVLGKRNNERLVPVEEKTDLVEITGFVMKPEFIKRGKKNQYLFINNRFVKNTYLNRAIYRSFKGLIPNNYTPSFFIKLKIISELIDINMHANKTEIFVKNRKVIFEIIISAVRKSLGQYNISPSIDFQQENSFNLNEVDVKREIKEPKIKINPSYNPFEKNNSTIRH